MAHLASGPGFSLAIEMQDRIRFSGEFGGPADVGADQVLHHAIGMTPGISERQAGDCPDMLLELGYGACRFCPVTRIMNPRGNFVDEKAVPVTFADGEELNREDADIVQVPGDRRGNLQRLGTSATFRSEAETSRERSRMWSLEGRVGVLSFACPLPLRCTGIDIQRSRRHRPATFARALSRPRNAANLTGTFSKVTSHRSK
jgi:hypothetical protein